MLNYKRKEIFDFFSQVSNPFYMVTFHQDVTQLIQFSKEHSLSFYYCMIYCVMKSLNEVEAFHYSLKDDEIIYLDKRNPSFTYLHKGEELFQIITMDMEEDIFSFCEHARQKCFNQNCFIDFSSETEDLAYISCLPWIELTALTNERDLSNPASKDSSIPNIAWGKYKEENGKWTLGLSIEVNHRFIDGIHIGQFANHLTTIIHNL